MSGKKCQVPFSVNRYRPELLGIPKKKVPGTFLVTVLIVSLHSSCLSNSDETHVPLFFENTITLMDEKTLNSSCNWKLAEFQDVDKSCQVICQRSCCTLTAAQKISLGRQARFSCADIETLTLIPGIGPKWAKRLKKNGYANARPKGLSRQAFKNFTEIMTP